MDFLQDEKIDIAFLFDRLLKIWISDQLGVQKLIGFYPSLYISFLNLLFDVFYLVICTTFVVSAKQHIFNAAKPIIGQKFIHSNKFVHYKRSTTLV